MTSYEVKHLVELAQRVINFQHDIKLRDSLGGFADGDADKVRRDFLHLVYTSIGCETVKLHLSQLENPTEAEHPLTETPNK